MPRFDLLRRPVLGILAACCIGLSPPLVSAARAGPDQPVPLTPVIGLDPLALDFEHCLAPGQCEERTFTIFNAVDDPTSRLEVTAIQLAASHFALVGGPAPPFSIPGDGTRITFTILFCSNGSPAIGLVIALAANAHNSPSYVTLSGDIDPPPVCDAGGPYAGVPHQAVTFNGSGSYDPNGVIARYRWDFGDGGSGSEVFPQHTYTALGTYRVTLRVEDRCWARSCTTSVDIGTSNLPPVCSPGGPYAGLAGVAIQLDGTASQDPDGTIAAYRWEFGDGRTATDPAPTHVYFQPASYAVTLRVTDDRGAASLCATAAAIGLPNSPPWCNAGGPYLAVAGANVTFDGGGSSDPDGTITAYRWQFGDGATGSGVRPVHAYQNPGGYPIQLCVTDDAGGESCCTSQATVLPPGAPLTPVLAVAPAELDFGQCTPLGAGSDLALEVYNAAFDPQSILHLDRIDLTGAAFELTGGPALPLELRGDGTRAVFSCRFIPAGIDPETGAANITAPGAVHSPLTVPLRGTGNLPPICDPGGPYAAVAGTPIQFVGSRSSDPGGGPITYAWDFGDGSTTTGADPAHVYADHGAYTVTLTVTDVCAAETASTTLAEIDGTPVCDPGGPYFAPPQVPVQFDARASHDPDGMIVAYDWAFGDGGTGTGPMPTHAYAVTSLFTVRLVVTDDDAHASACTTVVSTMVSPVVTVDSLNAEIRGSEVLLTWRATNGLDLIGFEVRRGREGGLTARIDGRLVTDDDGDGRFAFGDPDAALGERHRYEIFAWGRAGEYELAGSLVVALPALALRIHPPRPHPAAAPVDIAFDLPTAGHARARVIAAGGRVVAVLLDADVAAGRHHISWNGLDVRGRPASAGVYLIVLEQGGATRREKLVLFY